MTIKLFSILFSISLLSCIQQPKNEIAANTEVTKQEPANKEPHRYGGWYCPDNLNGFPAVDITEWQNVPVVQDRMPTQEETRNGSSLIFVDAEMYPEAKPLDMKLPKLATIYNQSTNREELIIVIQAINITNDSIVGFRYINGGNGSAHLSEIELLKEDEIQAIPQSKFVSHSIIINTKQDTIWNVLRNPENAEILRPFFDPKNKLSSDWRQNLNVNYCYDKTGETKALYADKLFGCFYIQNDFAELSYTEKFLLLEDPESGTTEFKIVCGPFLEDYDLQNKQLLAWGQKVKELSE